MLALAPDPASSREQERRDIDEFKASPKLRSGATRAQNDARMNADAGAPLTIAGLVENERTGAADKERLGPDGVANGALIVQAVNSHDELIEIATIFTKAVSAYLACGEWGWSGVPDLQETYERARDVLAEIAAP